MSLIKFDSVSLGYSETVVEDLSFTVEAGDYLCIVGENGSGKSTLIKTLLGLIGAKSGNITFGEGLRRDEIGYLPQQSAWQKDFPASVFEVVLSGCLSRSYLIPFYSKKQKALARDNMARMGISHLENECFRSLSGGQQQRVLLSRALCASSRLLLLDEPVAALDAKVTQEMYSIISELNRGGVTVIMVSHDIEAAARQASHILHLSRRPKFFGRAADYIKSDAYTSALRGGGAK